MTDVLRALLRSGYEPGDGSADDAQIVDKEWWHPAFGCDSLQKVVDNARPMLELSPLATQQTASPAPVVGGCVEQDFDWVVVIAQVMRARGIGFAAIAQHLIELLERVNHRRPQPAPAAPAAPGEAENPVNLLPTQSEKPQS